MNNPTPDYCRAAKAILTPEAAERYCAGDMTATDQAGHEAIEREVRSEIENSLPPANWIAE